MTSTLRLTVVVGVMFSLLATHACQVGASRIRGGSKSLNAAGNLSILTLESPDGKIVVAVKYPRQIDTSWYPGYGHSGNGDDVTHWEDLYKVRFKEGNGFVELIVHWEYSSRTHKLSFGEKDFDFPPGKLAILSYDKDQKPLCEFLENTPANMEQVRKQFGSENVKATPAAPSP